MRRGIGVAAAALLLAAVLHALHPAPAAAHPLGNATVNRSVAVTVALDEIEVRYTIDMAEVPAFVEIGAIDTSGDAFLDAGERASYADASCDTVRHALEMRVDDEHMTLTPAAAPELAFPPGVGGLETLRLVCRFMADAPPLDAPVEVAIADRTDDGRLGLREVSIAAAAGVRLDDASVPSHSPSRELTAYPEDTLDAPPDVREGWARVVGDAASGGAESGSAAAGASDEVAPAADDPLAGLIAGDLTPPLVALAFLVSAGLGAGHALTPGHGKTLVAGYLMGSRASLRQAATLGLTVAVAHTAGVLILGLVTLLAGELLVPDRVVSWLSLVAGAIVVALGVGLLWRALRPSREVAHDHADHRHDAEGGHVHHAHAHPTSRPIGARGMLLLGLAGGLVPSTSALIVLLVAITTGRVLLGLALIVAFGLGMAFVMASVAVVVARLGPRLGRFGASANPMVARGLAVLPMAAGVIVLATGIALALGAALRIG